VLRYLAERTGLIEERGLKEYGFNHRTLQEYFAALGVLNAAESRATVPELLKPFLFDPQWAEVVRLVASKVTPPVAESLLKEILDDPDPVGRFVRRGNLLALKSLSDGVRVPDPNIIRQLFEDCIAIAPSRWLGITIDHIRALQQFFDTRLCKSAKETIAKIYSIAEKNLSQNVAKRVPWFAPFDGCQIVLGRT